MAFVPRCLVAPFLVLITGAASAQIVPEPPFVGQQSDSFETQTSGIFTPCIQGRVFNNTADLCDPAGSMAHITTSWGFMCSIFPQSGAKLFGSGGGPAIYTFDVPATRFGGFFGTNAGVPDATIEFYDTNGNLISSHLATIPATCGWTWNGWRVTGGSAIKSIKIIGLNSFGGGFIDLDSMEVDYGTPCPLPTTYCTPKTNSLGCTPTLSSNGTPSATAPSGMTLFAGNVRNQKPGLLLYSTTGRAATAFGGGLLCLQLPVRRSIVLNSGGSALPASDCSGVYAIDMNSFGRGALGGHPLASLSVPGTVVDCQFWGVDPGFPSPNAVTLSEGIEFVVCP
ncbi:MAG: hypothetical protein IPK67_01490 [Planctomycetes bacterium]|nr:hypothetical protein [Planctomycetota bacterium]